MRIGELAARSGVSTKTLRFYEQAGVLGAPARSRGGYRDYDDNALQRLRFVRSAQAAGLTLAEVRQIIAIRERNGPPCAHVTALLEQHLRDLDARVNELTAMRADVHQMVKRSRKLDPGGCRPEDVCHVIPLRP